MVHAIKSKRAARRGATAEGEDRRRDLLEAAYVVIAEKGLEGLRTRDIAARAGVNISTLHYYFGTKDALIVAVVEHVREKLTGEGAAQRDARPGDNPPTLEAHLESAWRTFQTTPHLSTVLQELVLRAQRDPRTRAAFRAIHEGWNARVEDVMRSGVERGALRADLDPRAGAPVVTACIIGAMTQLSVNPEGVRLRHRDPRAHALGREAAEMTRSRAPRGARAHCGSTFHRPKSHAKRPAFALRLQRSEYDTPGPVAWPTHAPSFATIG